MGGLALILALAALALPVDAVGEGGLDDEKFGTTPYGPYVGVAFAVLFLAPFFDPRRPFRALHFDLLALLAFGLSHVFLNREQMSVAVPLLYPVLAYLFARMLVAGYRPREHRARLVPIVPATGLAIGIVLLFGCRVALNVTTTDVIDVGYASVVGADRIAHGEGLYGGDFPRLTRLDDDGEVDASRAPGDVYGPSVYLAYLPFEQVFPWSGTWDDVPAAHAAALTFELLTVIGLFLLGRSLRDGREGETLGLGLAFAWLSYPYTLFGLQLNTNDALVAMLLVYALLALKSAAGRGVMLGLAGAAKFAPLAIVPLFASGLGERRPRQWMTFVAALLGVLLVTTAPFIPSGGLDELYDRTLGFQASRESQYSIWGQHPSLDWLQTLIRVAVIGLALVVAFVPRRRSPMQVAALGAAVIIGVQIVLNHWFYSYIVWFAPYVLVALFAAQRSPASRPTAPPVGAWSGPGRAGSTAPGGRSE